MSIPAFQRIARRETHSPRTVAMVITAIVIILVLAYVGTEILLKLLGQPPLLFAPATSADFLADLATQQPVALIITIAVAVAILGLILIIVALTPGRLAKHRMQLGDRVVLVDNGVIAAAVAQHVSDETGIARNNVTVGVSHRSIDVTLTTDTPTLVDTSRIRQLVDAEVDSYQLTPPIKTRVRDDSPTGERA